MKQNRVLLWILLLQLVMIGAVTRYILIVNEGHFIYTMDDAYIFLSIAQHHFMGITHGVIANASSSLLGVYILTLFQSHMGTLFPLILNTTISLLTTACFWKILSAPREKNIAMGLRLALVILLIITTQQIALVFTGMEHTIQVLLCAIAFYIIIYEHENKKIPWWACLVVIALPLWRYDCLAIFTTMVLYFYFKQYLKQALICLVTTSVILTLYFAWWHAQGEFYFPTSLVVKSNAAHRINFFLQDHAVSTQTFIAIVFSALVLLCGILCIARKWVVGHSRILAIVIAMMCIIGISVQSGIYLRLLGMPLVYLSILAFSIYIFISAEFNFKQLLALMIVIQLSLYAIMMSDVSQFRFEAYLYVFIILGFYFIFKNTVLFSSLEEKPLSLLLSVIALYLLVLQYNVVSPLWNVGASSAIYRQQYQMARFARDYYKAPVGVNDVGLVAYNNPHKVIDLCGLGYPGVINKSEKSIAGWCASKVIPEAILKKENLGLLMIYVGMNGFEAPPKEYILAANLIALPPYGAIASPVVRFYVLPADYARTLQLLRTFKDTLPPGVILQLPDK